MSKKHWFYQGCSYFGFGESEINVSRQPLVISVNHGKIKLSENYSQYNEYWICREYVTGELKKGEKNISTKDCKRMLKEILKDTYK